MTSNQASIGGQLATITCSRTGAGQFHIFEWFSTPQERYGTRKVVVLVPETALEGGAPHKVLYLNDGAAVFFSGGVANQSLRMAQRLGELYAGRSIEPLIVVAVYHVARDDEYTRFDWSLTEGRGLDGYAHYLARTIVPFVDANYPSLRTPPGRMIMGSSHGGLAAFYTAMQHPDCFGNVGALSPSFWVDLDDATHFPVIVAVPEARIATSKLAQRIKSGLAVYEARPQIFISWGLLRSGGPHNEFIEERAAARAREMADYLCTVHGYVLGRDLIVFEDPQGAHNEASWSDHSVRALRHFAGR